MQMRPATWKPGTSLAIGLVLGSALGLVLGWFAFWLSIGLVFGIIAEGAQQARLKKDEPTEGEPPR